MQDHDDATSTAHRWGSRSSACMTPENRGLATLNYVSAVEKGEALEWQQSIDKPSPTMSSFLLNYVGSSE